MLVVKKLCRVFLFTFALTLAISLILLVYSKNYIKYDLQITPFKQNDSKSIQRAVKIINDQQNVLNEDIHGPLMNDSVIIVIQVHKRITYLRYLIASLAQARDISKTMLIFSHDFYDEEINELVQSIDFCKVMQIFYPFSIQMHPNEFPGNDPNDCKRDMEKQDALVAKCNNAQYPDLYGHYREASFTQTKHHWWWKANRVFDQLEATRHHTGLVLFLEEDHYVAEDFLHFLNLMKNISGDFSTCEVLTLGNYDGKLSVATFDKVRISNWISNKHNMGMAIGRTTWQKIKACAKFFCTYDDYNWDWSLQFTSQSCSQLKVLFAAGSRVFHIGENGLHHKRSGSEVELSELTNVENNLKTAKKFLFPEGLSTLEATTVTSNSIMKPNGGWADLRDISLCFSISNKT